MDSDSYDPIATWKRDAVVKEGRVFPQTNLISPQEGSQVRAWLLDATGLRRHTPNRALLDALYSGAQTLPGYGRMDEGCGVEEVLQEAGIVSETVLLLLPLEGAFESGVRMARRDLIDFFDNLWYPSTDDLIVIDEQRETLLLIDHHGRVGKMSLGRRPNQPS